MLDLLPSFGNVALAIAAFIVALSVIVAVHEYGHYIVGRWCGIQAEVFSIGFKPALYSWRDRRGTLWQIGALPFGGYVKFLGDTNAASIRTGGDAVGNSATARRDTLEGAPLWARTATVAAGPLSNFLLSIVAFAAVLAIRGIASEPLTVDSLRAFPGFEQTLREGDRIVSVEGLATPSVGEFAGFIDELPVRETLDYTVLRDGETLTLEAPYPFPPLVGGVTPRSSASDAGLRAGDAIVAANGDPLFAFQQLREAVADSQGRSLSLDVWRDGEIVEVELAPRPVDLPSSDGGFETRYLIGVSGDFLFEPMRVTPGPVLALAHGVESTVYVLGASISGLYHMAKGAISSCNLSGPIGIAEVSGEAASAGWLEFVQFVAVISAAIGLLNLFPIPILDGGHLAFYAYEALRGRPPVEGVMRALTVMGLALIGALMVFALYNDIFCP